MLSTYQHTNVKFKDPSSNFEDPTIRATTATQTTIKLLY